MQALRIDPARLHQFEHAPRARSVAATAPVAYRAARVDYSVTPLPDALGDPLEDSRFGLTKIQKTYQLSALCEQAKVQGESARKHRKLSTAPIHLGTHRSVVQNWGGRIPPMPCAIGLASTSL